MLAKLTRLLDLELLDTPSSGPCYFTIHAAAIACCNRAVHREDLDVTKGNNPMQVLEDFDKLGKDEFSLAVQVTRAMPKERLKLACKHRLRRFTSVARRIMHANCQKQPSSSSTLRYSNGSKTLSSGFLLFQPTVL